MFKNRKLIRLMIAVAITVVMGSVYLLSLQWVDDASNAQEDEVVQEINAVEQEATKEEVLTKEGAAEHAESPSDGLAHGAAHEKAAEGKALDKGAKHGDEREDKAHAKKESLSAEHGASDKHGEHAPEKAHTSPGAESSEQEGSADLSKKYKPRIIGRCKVLYERFNKMELQAHQFHAFAYSFDGKSGYCADSGAQNSAKLAKEIALSDCEKNKGSAESYAPCFIYSSDK